MFCLLSILFFSPRDYHFKVCLYKIFNSILRMLLTAGTTVLYHNYFEIGFPGKEDEVIFPWREEFQEGIVSENQFLLHSGVAASSHNLFIKV